MIDHTDMMKTSCMVPAEFESTKIAMFMNEFANLTTQSIKKIKDLGFGHDF
jgi:hypothetical protein